MADQKITELPIKTSSGIAATDYLLGIDSAEGYQMLIQDLGNYIINNVQATLGGIAQTLATAINALVRDTYALNYSGMDKIPQNEDLNTYTTPGSFVSTSSNVTKTLLNCPFTDTGFSLHVESITGTTGQYLVQTIKRFYSGTDVYTRAYNGSTWTNWQQVPTRAEIDALNSKISSLYDLTQASGTSLLYGKYIECGKIVIYDALIELSANKTTYDVLVSGLPNATNPGSSLPSPCVYDSAPGTCMLSHGSIYVGKTISAMESGKKVRVTGAYIRS